MLIFFKKNERTVKSDSAKVHSAHSNSRKASKQSQPAIPKQSSNDPYLLSITYLDHLSTLPPLPHKIHIFFPDKHYYNTHRELSFVQHSILALMSLNPAWKVTVYDDDMIDDVIIRGVEEGLISKEEFALLVGKREKAHIIERSDIARLILMYLEGGFYIDADRLVSVPMSKIVTDKTKLCLPTSNDVIFTQDLQCSSPKNKLYREVIKGMSSQRMKGHGGKPLERRKGWIRGGEIFEMGPILYNKKIFEMMFDHLSIDEHGFHDPSTYEKAREALAKSEYLVTKADRDCFDGLLVDKSIKKCYDREELYDAYKMKPWAEEVDALWKGDEVWEGEKKGDGDTNNNNAKEVHAGKKYDDRHLFKLNPQYLDHLRSLQPLPKKIHIFFPDKRYYETQKDLPFVQHSIIALMQLNPDWNVTVFDNDDIDNVIRGAGVAGLISTEEANILVGAKDLEGNVLTPPAHIVERSDIARLILMYTDGGFYIDADRLVSVPMSKILSDSTKLCLPTYHDENFCQDLQCTSPSNELFLSMIRDCSEFRMKKGPDGGPLERRNGWIKGGSLFDMGPVAYNRNILKTVFDGVTYDNILSLGGYSKARESLIHSNGSILTQSDASAWCDDGLLFDKSIQCHSRSDLYNKYGMKAWGQEVDEVWKDR
jgi:mannosyltransferase OCH1-like enzyme